MRHEYDAAGERAVHAAPVGSPPTSTGLFEVWRELDVPEGWCAESIEERIVMTPPPGHEHNLVADQLHRLFVRDVPDHWAIFQTAGVSVAPRVGFFVPDLLVIPRDRVPSDADAAPVPAALGLLAAEITSLGDPETDRTTKLRAYAGAEVPLYPLVDRHGAGGPTMSLYSDPTSGHYRHLVQVPFGDGIELPEPFGFRLDTTRF
ncbi:Endonuclease, Uma2 family (restriction endonuclease fold) [Actinopolyspora xinjiangensis]|uniref:Endonuclease, Uma2 family (Restriction endonuclease fold) n=1 Tax=Actinopolyspora xinjiangensis TaxID=405564 RepID=A0A1H0PA37_9ACTN|nr:Uma2 family endonuclease [Actinopolyspora xinjiangensis]SDP01486.1 Endonuclease, Uma2 family (restriction endonuclease fold) [Actinopolyspora xinjiangensis]